MDQKKLPNLLSTDDLLSSLEEQDITETESLVDEYDKTVTEFVLRYNLKPGNDFISSSVLYPLFKLNSKEDISPWMLNRYFAIHLPRSKTGFMVDLKASRITKELIGKVSAKNKTISKFRTLDFQEFIDFYNIKQGNKKIESNALYSLYKDWAKNNRKKKLNEIKFLTFFKDRIKLYVTKEDKKYFKLTKTLEEMIGRESFQESERQVQSEEEGNKETQQPKTTSIEETKKEATIQKSEIQVSILKTGIESKD